MYIFYLALLLWAGWVIGEYTVFHAYVERSITELPYPGLLVTLITLGLGTVGWWHLRRRSKTDTGTVSIKYRGLTAYLFVQAFSVMTLLAFTSRGYIPDFSPVLGVGQYLLYSTGFILLLLVLISAAYVIGDLAISPLNWKADGGRALVAVALGIATMGFALVLLGLMGLFNVYVSWLLIVLILAFNWKSAWAFVSELSWRRHTMTLQHWWSPLIVVLIAAVVGCSIPASFKTFPIGYDGGALYVNLAKLTVDSSGLPYGGQSFAWSLMMALGWVLTGTITAGILLSNLIGLLCAMIVYHLARLFLSSDYARLAVLITLVSPYFAFHVIVEEKVDLALTFVVISAVYLAIRMYWQAKAPPESSHMIRLWGRAVRTTSYSIALVGWLAGYAFSIKYTAAFFAMALVCWLGYRHLGRRGYFTAFLGLNGLLFLGGIYRFGYLDIPDLQGRLLGATFLVASLLTVLLPRRPQTRSLMNFGFAVLLFGASFSLAFAPWAAKHVAENGNLGITHLLEGRSLQPELNFMPGYSYGYPPSEFDSYLMHNPHQQYDSPYRLVSQQQGPGDLPGRNATSVAAREEIQRYLGYEPFFWRYFSLPFDLTLGINLLNNRYLDVGFLFLLFLPILLLGNRSQKGSWKNFLFASATIATYMAGAYFSAFAASGRPYRATEVSNRIEELTATGQASILADWQGVVRYPALVLGELLAQPFALLANLAPWLVILLMVIIFLLAARLFARRANKLGSILPLVGLLASMAYFWWIMGNGIVWYALPLFVAAPILIIYFSERPEELLGATHAKFSRYFMGAVISAFLALNLFTYFSSQYPNETDPAALYRWPFVEIMTDFTATDPNDAIDKFNPVISEVMHIINANPQDKIYRVNTHFGFLIDRNDTRVYSDPALERYDQITRRLTDKDRFFDILKAQGYRYILFDLRMGSIDRTPEQSLKQKFLSIARQLTTSDKVQLLVTDNYIADATAPSVTLPDGRQTNARYGLHGRTVQLGNLALFEIR